MSFLFWWELVDSNHRSIKQQIYSLSPLATRESSLILLSAPGVRVLDYYSKGIRKMQAFFSNFLNFFLQIAKRSKCRDFCTRKVGRSEAEKPLISHGRCRYLLFL